MRLLFDDRAKSLSIIGLILPFFILSALCAETAYQVHFNQDRFDIAPGETFSVQAIISPRPLAGVFSHGVRLSTTVPGAITADPESIFPNPALNHNGVRGTGAVKLFAQGTLAAKGTVDFLADPIRASADADLVTFRLTDRTPAAYELQLAFFNSLGTSEDVFVDGAGNTLDRKIIFRSALINHRPTVRVIQPPLQSMFEQSANVTMVAEASDSDGTVSLVEFFDGNKRIGESRTPPYSALIENAASGIHTIVARAHDDFGAVSSSQPMTFTVFGGSSIEILSPIRLNRQTGLFEQLVRVRNVQNAPMAAVRVLVQGLPPNARVFNAGGTIGSVPYIQYNQALARGANVDFKIEYFLPDREAINQPDLIAESVNPDQPSVAFGMIFHVNRQLRLDDGSFLIEFTSLRDRGYAIEYSADLATWRTAIPAINGNGSQVQWIDSGPPKTESRPAAETERFYRVVLLP